MTFTDELTFVMITLILVAVTVAYIVVSESIAYWRRGPRALGKALHEVAVPVIAMGMVSLAIGLWGLFTWPLPGAYNILFFDCYTLFAIIVLCFGIALGMRYRLQFVGVLSLVAGTAVIAYGWRAYQLGLTSVPWAMFLIYLGFGATAILAFPVSLVADSWLSQASEETPASAPVRGRNGSMHYPVSWLQASIVLIFVIVILLSACAVEGTLYNAIITHLNSPP